MSLYKLRAKGPRFSIALGFDRPMECYFFQLWNLEEDDEEPIINVDTRKNYEVLTLMDQYVDLTQPQAQDIRDGISGDWDPEIWLDMEHKRKETERDVKQMFDLVGKKVPQ